MSNIYLHFRDNRTKLFHNIATELKNQNIVENIGASVVGQDGYQYLSDQDEIQYDPLILESDVRKNIREEKYNKKRLIQLEKDYGCPTLNFYLTIASRFDIKNEEKQKAITQHWFDFYIKLFSQFDPDLFLTDDVGHLSKVIPFVLTKTDFGKSVWWHSTRILDRYAFSTSVFDRFSNISRHYSQIKNSRDDPTVYEHTKKKAESYSKRFEEEAVKPQYTIDNNDNSSRDILNKFKFGVEYFFESYKNDYKNDYMNYTALQLCENYLKKLYRLRYIDHNKIFDTVDYNEQYVFFPLHLQPEWSTLVLAQPFIDQTLAVKQVANNLPMGYKLYVKDHPRMFGSRSLSYYRKLRSIPRVQLLDPRLNSHGLINNSDLVTTITGTAGLEAALLNVPSIVFGNPYYSRIDSVNNVTNIYNIEELIFENIENDVCEQKDVINFLTAVFEGSFKSRYPSNIPDSQTGEEAKKIVNNLIGFRPVSDIFS